MQNDDDKRTFLLKYSIKVALGIGVAILILSLLAFSLGDKIDMRWIFLPVWVIALFFVLRGIYLKWFK